MQEKNNFFNINFSKTTTGINLHLIILILFFSSCNHDYAPKPRGYFRIDLPEKKYTPFVSGDCPFTFEIPQYAKIVRDTNRFAEPCWMYLKFLQFNGEVFISYKEVNNNLSKFLEDTHTLVYKHTVKADQISEKRINNQHNVYGVLYDIGGNAASSVQFFATDSTRHFIRGALYFNVVPNNDSISPVLNFIKKDVEHFLSTLVWKNS